MPLNERERRILDEIERQFRTEDPELERQASLLHRARPRYPGLPIAGVAIGLTLLGTFWLDGVGTFLALGGFVVTVVSVTALIQVRRNAGEVTDHPSGGFLSGTRNGRWPFRR